MEMKSIVSRSASLARQRSVAPEEIMGKSVDSYVRQQQQVIKQDTFESEPLEFVGDVPVVATSPSGADEVEDEVITFEAPPERDEQHDSSPTREPLLGIPSMKARHTSSGGSEDAISTQQSFKKKKVRHAPQRKRMVTDSSDDDYQTRLALVKQTSVHDPSEIGYPEDVAAVVGEEQSITDENVEDDESRQVKYKRAQSEIAPSTTSHPSATGMARLMSAESGIPTRGPGTSSINDESDDSCSMHKFGRGISLKTRRRIASNRDYTSITDELECLIPAPMIPDTSVSPCPPAIQVESENLRDAEEADFLLMESLIQRRLRRDSHNLQASLEELVTKSIRDENTSNSGDGAFSPGQDNPKDEPKLDITVTAETQEQRTGDIQTDTHPSSTRRDASVRIRLNEGADQVEIEFIDENNQSNC